MTDRILTPEIYGDFGLYLDQIGVRKKPTQPEEKPTVERKIETNDWYKNGEECPF